MRGAPLGSAQVVPKSSEGEAEEAVALATTTAARRRARGAAAAAAAWRSRTAAQGVRMSAPPVANCKEYAIIMFMNDLGCKLCELWTTFLCRGWIRV